MNHVLGSLIGDVCVVHVDDIVIFSDLELVQRVRMMIKRLQHHGLFASVEKSVFYAGMGPYRPRVALALFLILSLSQSAIGRSGWGFLTVRGGFDSGGHFFRPWLVRVVDIRRHFETGDGDQSSLGEDLWIYVGTSDPGKIPYCPRVDLALFRAPANQRSAVVAGVSTSCAAVSTREISVFVPGLLEL